MDAAHLLELYAAFEAAGVRVWIDGGWAVDAAVGHQTRPHDDLDVAVQTSDVPALLGLLAARGFRRVPGDTPDWNFVLAAVDDRRIDVHAVAFDPDGRAVLGRVEAGTWYPAGALDGVGHIEGVAVRCVAPAFMLQFKLGYEPRDIDVHDIALLRGLLDLDA